jgi:hypothetical protein
MLGSFFLMFSRVSGYYPVKINLLDQFRVTMFTPLIIRRWRVFDCSHVRLGTSSVVFAVRNSFVVPIDCTSHVRWSSLTKRCVCWLLILCVAYQWGPEGCIGRSRQTAVSRIGHSPDNGYSPKFHVRPSVCAPAGFCCFGCAGMLGCGRHQRVGSRLDTVFPLNFGAFFAFQWARLLLGRLARGVHGVQGARGAWARWYRAWRARSVCVFWLVLKGSACSTVTWKKDNIKFSFVIRCFGVRTPELFLLDFTCSIT